MFVRAGFPFNYDQEAASDQSGLACEGESRTLQSQAKDADINVIVKRFGVTGVLPQTKFQPMFGDFTEVGDYRSALDAVRAAEQSFMTIPAEIRARFGNDPGAFLDFVSDPANIEELRKMGLAVPKEVSRGRKAEDASGGGVDASVDEDDQAGVGAREQARVDEGERGSVREGASGKRKGRGGDR